MNVETLIYIYLAICTSMIVFNCVCIFVFKRRRRLLTRHSKHFEREIAVQIARTEANHKADKNHQKFLISKFRRIGNLIAFDQTLEALQKESPEKIRDYIRSIYPVFVYIALGNMYRDKMKSAYFAYLVAKYHMIPNSSHEPITEKMMTLLQEPSMYCRENGLNAIYSSGSWESVMRALHIIDEGNIFHHPKLLTDGLLTFTGDRDRLIRAMWEEFNTFSVRMRVVILNFIRFSTGGWEEKMLALLSDKNQDDEIRFSCIRYLGKYPYEPAYPVLLEFAEHPDSCRWEYTAITASALASYFSPHTIEVLKDNLHHSNWYVRLNASRSLDSFHLTYTDLVDIFDGNDRYAREILQYQFDLKHIREQEVAAL